MYCFQTVMETAGAARRLHTGWYEKKKTTRVKEENLVEIYLKIKRV